MTKKFSENSALKNSIVRLQLYIEEENYSGYDPYDALSSPLFKLPFLRSNKMIRFGAQQLVKRSSINLRPLLFVPKKTNPVTLGLCIQAYCNLLTVYPEKKEALANRIHNLINQLTELSSKNFSGACWGYDFDWEARYATVGAYQPTIVATGIISNALFIAYHTTDSKKAKELFLSSVNFVLKDLHQTSDENGNICFSYSPFDHEKVFNANMKAVRILSQVYSQTNDEHLKKVARKAVNYVMKHQRDDGAWIYSESKAGGWIDNYHTGYILDCLDEYIKCTGDTSYSTQLEKGCEYYFNNFFEKNKIPRFYNQKTYPIDCTAAAQSLLSLTRFGKTDLASNVAEWMIEKMQDEKGYFYFRKYSHMTEKTSFMRWSNAWMFAGLTELLKVTKQQQ